MPETTETVAAPPASQVNVNTDANDNTGNEINATGLWVAGIIIILLLLSSCLFIIAYWPDKLPSPKGDIKPLYTNEWFHVRLANISEDTTKVQSVKNSSSVNKEESGLIHLNTILLILVAAGGFMGNLIFMGSSLTTHVGARNFSKSWILWYCVNPFTAAALALGIYFVFRGGFLNMSDDSSNINLYGVMTLSVLAGLFTKQTTDKLQGVFGSIGLKAKKDTPAQPAQPKTDANGQDPKNKQEAADAAKNNADNAAEDLAATADKTDGAGELKDVNDVVSDGPDQPDDKGSFVKE